MDRQTLRDWVHRFNDLGPDGLRDIRSKGNPPRLTKEQLAELAVIVETGPDRAVHGVVPVASHRLEDGHRTPLWRCLPRTHHR